MPNKKEVSIYLKTVNQMGAGITQARKDLKSVGDAGEKAFKMIAAAAAAAFAAIAAGATVMGSAFEQGLANAASMFSTAADGAKELAGWTEMLGVKARELGAKTAFTATEVTSAMYALASGGLRVNDTIGTTEAVVTLAGATMFDMTMTAELLMGTMNQFGKVAKDTTDIVNTFAAGIQNSQLNMIRLENSMKFAGPPAAALGLTIEQTVAALAALHNVGLKGSLAGTGLRMAFLKILKPAESLKELLGGVSISVDGFRAVLLKLEKGALSPEQIAVMFGPRAFGAIRALTRLGSIGFERMTKAVTGTRSAAEMYAIQMDTVRNQTKILKSAVQENFIAIFMEIEPLLRSVLGNLQDWVRGSKSMFVDVFSSIKDAVEGSLPAIREFSKEVTDSFEKITVVIEPMRSAVVWMYDTFSRNKDVVLSLSKATGLASIALLGMLKLFSAMKRLFKVNWFYLAILGIITSFNLFVEKMGGWRAFLIGLANTWGLFRLELVFEFQHIIADFMWLHDSLGLLKVFFSNLWKGFGRIFKTGGSMLGEIMQTVVDAIMDPWKSRTIFADISDIIKKGWNELALDVKHDLKTLWPDDANAEDEIRRNKIEEDYFKGLADLKRSIALRIARLNKTTTDDIGIIPRLDPEIVKEYEDFISDGAFAAAIAGIGPVLTENLANTWKEWFAFFGKTTKKSLDRTFNVWTEFTSGIRNVGQRAWDSIISTSMTGAEKWKAIWKNGSEFIWGLLGKTVIAKLAGDKIIAASAIKTGVVEQGVAQKTAIQRMWAAYAGMPFIGQILTLAAIGVMMSSIGKMHSGGLIGGTTGSGSYREQAFIGQRGEFVMPVSQTAANLPLLEAMRRGQTPALSAAGVGGRPSFNITIAIPAGSLIVADDSMAVRRLAEKISDEIDERVSKKWRA